jgi:hypothetical protein
MLLYLLGNSVGSIWRPLAAVFIYAGIIFRSFRVLEGFNP